MRAADIPLGSSAGYARALEGAGSERDRIMADDASSFVQRRRLRTELKRARQEKGLTQEQTAKAMDWSLSKMIRVETATTGISTNDLKVLLPLYDITDTERTEHFISLARAVRERPWWSAYRDVAPLGLLELIEFESVALTIRQSETEFIPGILQTEEYARLIIQDYQDEKPDSARVTALVELRTRREELLDRENPPRFFFMLDEAVIRRLVGGSPVMRRQLRRLTEVAEKPNIEIDVVPFSAGLHPGMKGPFEIIEFADAADKDVVFLESPRAKGADTISDKPEDTLKYHEDFERIGKTSLGPRDSVSYISEIAEGLK
jgi:transcriptional regulator with XRE-family HTH domain